MLRLRRQRVARCYSREAIDDLQYEAILNSFPPDTQLLFSFFVYEALSESQETTKLKIKTSIEKYFNEIVDYSNKKVESTVKVQVHTASCGSENTEFTKLLLLAATSILKEIPFNAAIAQKGWFIREAMACASK